MTKLTNQNFDEILNQIQQCDNQENLPIIQIDLVRPKITIRFLWFLSIFISGIFGLLLSFINGNFDEIGLLFFGFFCSFSAIFLTIEIKNYKIKAFWNNSDDIFYCQLTPTHFIYHLNSNELKLDWEKLADISYIWGGKNSQNHIMITQKNGKLILIFKSQTKLNIKELEKPLNVYFRKCRTFNFNTNSTPIFGFKL